jgi:hypothetical protein
VKDGLLSATGAADVPPAPNENDGLLSVAAAAAAAGTVAVAGAADAPPEPKENEGLLSVAETG